MSNMVTDSGLSMINMSSSGSSSVGTDVTNANGEFRLENVTPGTYMIFTVASAGSDVPSASVTFEVVDRDLTDLVIKDNQRQQFVGRGEHDGNQRAFTTLSSLRICAAVESNDSDFANSSSAIGQDGTFRIDGVQSGLTRLLLCANKKRDQFEIVRVERNGIRHAETINVKEREHVTGIRVTVKYSKLTGAIRGQVKVENGDCRRFRDSRSCYGRSTESRAETIILIRIASTGRAWTLFC